MKRASYMFGVEWIALNDDRENVEPTEVEGTISVMLLADLFGKEPSEVAHDVVNYRLKFKDT